MHVDTHPSPDRERKLAFVLAMTTVFLAAEVVGGLWTRSLALLADAAHMFTDAAGVGLALVAMRFARKPATPERTYGFYRAEILAALVNAVVLIAVSLYVLYEAYERFLDPPTVASQPMLAIAALGLVLNLIAMKLLKGGADESLNMKGAYFEVLSDMLASLGVLVAAGVMWATDWYYADPLVSAGIGLFIFPRTWRLLREAVGVLLEGTPSQVNLGAVRASLESVPGVRSVHDLHIWTLTSGVYLMTAHALIGEEAVHEDVLGAACARLSSTFGIKHVTLQLERDCCAASPMHA